jgi:hypothetical protein
MASIHQPTRRLDEVLAGWQLATNSRERSEAAGDIAGIIQPVRSRSEAPADEAEP